MGREVEEQARGRGHNITARIDNEDDWKNQEEGLKSARVAIEFSLPETAKKNILRCFDYGLAVVSGTTGWIDSLDEVRKACEKGNQAFFYASNFSPGMNIMFELNSKLARLMSRQNNYRILIEEIHHTGKKDSPSGTAITLADEIIRFNTNKTKWVNRPANDNDELEIISVRRNHVAGTHYVKYDSDMDSLEIRHSAHSRKGFALGALLAAEYIEGKKGCFSMKDLLYDEES
jgi:4-hydroxy-tetrahydrodipicolinate reductase